MRIALKPLAPVLAALVLGAAGAGWWKTEIAAQVPVVAVAVAVASGAAVPALGREAPAVVAPDSAPAPAPDHGHQLARTVERALVAADPAQRETVFNATLPELLQRDPAEAAAMLARHPDGESRNLLREEVARRWIMLDREGAVHWLHSLDESDRHAAATTAMSALAAHSAVQAIELGEEFGVGGDDGSRDYLLQRWAAEDPEAARHWQHARNQSH